MLHMFIPFIAAAALGVHPAERRKRPHPSTPVLSAAGPSVAQERALRRRVVRLARIKMLERRQAMLFEFLAKSHTETPLFADGIEHDVGHGLFVGPTIVTLDFLGSPIVRATVRNGSSARAAPLLTAHLRTSDGAEFAVSAAVESIAPGETRHIDLECPTFASPVSVTWSAMP